MYSSQPQIQDSGYVWHVVELGGTERKYRRQHFLFLLVAALDSIRGFIIFIIKVELCFEYLVRPYYYFKLGHYTLRTRILVSLLF